MVIGFNCKGGEEMNGEKRIFEVITSRGGCLRYEGDEYRWQFALQEGSLERLDKSTVEIFEIDEEGDESLILTLPNIEAVGNCSWMTALLKPMEVRQTICPRCKFTEKEEGWRYK